MEDRVAEIIRKRLSFSGDMKLENFVCATNEKMISRVKKTELSDVLKKFGCEESEILQGVTAQEITYYSNAITNRHLVSHGGSSSFTLIEARRAFDAAEKILIALEKCIQ